MLHSATTSRVENLNANQRKGVPVSGFILICSFRFYCELVSGYFTISMPVSYKVYFQQESQIDSDWMALPAIQIHQSVIEFWTRVIKFFQGSTQPYQMSPYSS